MTSSSDANGRSLRTDRSSIWRSTRPIRLALSIGALSGFIAGGIGSRVAMRIIAMADSSSNGTFTDSKATVGEFTLSGTLSLLMLGAIAGAVAGPLYLGIRRWLPVPDAWNGAAFAAFTFGTVGYPLFDPANVDFQIFEPLALTLLLFSTLFLVNGLLLGWLLDRFWPERPAGPRSRVSIVVSSGLAVITVVGVLGLAGGMIGMFDDEGKCLRAVGGGEGCAVPKTQ